ncbi:MAG TPA: hypothetical protein VN381_09460 [Anaerovoracaceae bacterium]|nr:hypothetical protein [Anaerovoracaceae bacterium]
MVYRNQISPPAPPNIPQPGMTIPGVPVPLPGTPNLTEYLESEQLTLIGSLRQLWTQLAIWSRSLIVSTAANLGDIQAITDRLADLPEAFAALLGQYFEPQEADSFRELLEEHISTLEALITAEKNNNVQTVNQETVNLYNNASRIAAYLVSINAFWNQEQLSDLLYDYIEMMLADLVARLEGDYTKELDIFDDLLTQALKISDYMAQGMLQRFRP